MAFLNDFNFNERISEDMAFFGFAPTSYEEAVKSDRFRDYILGSEKATKNLGRVFFGQLWQSFDDAVKLEYGFSPASIAGASPEMSGAEVLEHYNRFTIKMVSRVAADTEHAYGMNLFHALEARKKRMEEIWTQVITGAFNGA